MPEGARGRRSRSNSLSGWAASGQKQREMAALILAQGDQSGNLDVISNTSKALLQVGNKPQLYYSIKQLEENGFEKNNIYVAISRDCLELYESDDRVIPIESRLPARNFVVVKKEFDSSVDSLYQAFHEIEKLDGLPRYLLVVYVDVITCGVLDKIATVNRLRDPAFMSVYGPRNHEIKDLPGSEALHQTEKVTKLVFMGGKPVLEDKEFEHVREVHLTIDTENYDDESIRLSSRVLSNSGGHIEVCSDIDDQGIFLIRDDLVKWIMRNVEGKHWCSIREDLVPALLKNKYRGSFSEDAEHLAYIDNESTWRLDSLSNYIHTHRQIFEGKLLNNFIAKSDPASIRNLKNLDICKSSIIGENVTRFNDAETERIAKEGNLIEDSSSSASHNSNQASDVCSKIFIRKSIIGQGALFEYDFVDNKVKTIQITNCIIHNDVTIRTGCKLNNCIISSGAVLGNQCTLVNCVVGPGMSIEPKKNLKNQCLESEENN